MGSSGLGEQTNPLGQRRKDSRLIGTCSPLRIRLRCFAGMEQASKSPFVFPSPQGPDQPISTVKTAWKASLKRAGIPHFPLYNLRHVFCTRLSGVAPDAVVQRAMRHTSPETKRHYQLGMADQVRQAMEKSNKKAYGRGRLLHFYDSGPNAKKEGVKAVCK